MAADPVTYMAAAPHVTYAICIHLLHHTCTMTSIVDGRHSRQCVTTSACVFGRGSGCSEHVDLSAFAIPNSTTHLGGRPTRPVYTVSFEAQLAAM